MGEFVLLQNTGHCESRQLGEGLSEIVHFAAIRVALLDILLRPRQPADLAANVSASHIRRNCGLGLVGIVEAHESDTRLGNRIVQHFPEHPRNGHFVGGSGNAQIQIHLVVVHIRKSSTTLQLQGRQINHHI